MDLDGSTYIGKLTTRSNTHTRSYTNAYTHTNAHTYAQAVPIGVRKPPTGKTVDMATMALAQVTAIGQGGVGDFGYFRLLSV
jgi:hypothetical protein